MAVRRMRCKAYEERILTIPHSCPHRCFAEEARLPWHGKQVSIQCAVFAVDFRGSRMGHEPNLIQTYGARVVVSEGRRAWLISHDQTGHGVAQKRAVANLSTCMELFPGELSISRVHTVGRLQRHGPQDFMGLRSSVGMGSGASKLAGLTEGVAAGCSVSMRGVRRAANIGPTNTRSFCSMSVSVVVHHAFIDIPISRTRTVVSHGITATEQSGSAEYNSIVSQ